MERILSLDISSSTIGWALVDYDDSIKQMNLVDQGHIKPMSKKKSKDNFSLRLDTAYRAVRDLIRQTRPDDVCVEEYARKFSKGRSSAHTIIVLSSFNEVCCLAIWHETQKEAIKYPVTTLRSRVGKKYNMPTKDKEEVLDLVKHLFPNDFIVTKNKNKNVKKETYDEADALFVTLGHIAINY